MLFWRRYKFVFTINICILETFVSEEDIDIFCHCTNIGIIILEKIKMIFIHIYLRCCKIPKEYGSNSSSISNYVNIFEITSTQHYTNLLRIGSQLRKCEETRDWKQQAHQLCRFNVKKSTWKTDRYFVDFESQIHVEISTSSRCHNFLLDLLFKVN